RDRLSFPTRRSSDLGGVLVLLSEVLVRLLLGLVEHLGDIGLELRRLQLGQDRVLLRLGDVPGGAARLRLVRVLAAQEDRDLDPRSEEHTSELQSQSN